MGNVLSMMVMVPVALQAGDVILYQLRAENQLNHQTMSRDKYVEAVNSELWYGYSEDDISILMKTDFSKELSDPVAAGGIFIMKVNKELHNTHWKSQWGDHGTGGRSYRWIPPEQPPISN